MEWRRSVIQKSRHFEMTPKLNTGNYIQQDVSLEELKYLISRVMISNVTTI